MFVRCVNKADVMEGEMDRDVRKGGWIVGDVKYGRSEVNGKCGVGR